MNPINLKNFRQYENYPGDSGPAKVGHVNAVIKALNEVAANSGSGGAYLFAGNSSTTTNIDWAQGNVQELNLDNNPSLTFSNGTEGTSLTLLLKQQLAGQRSIVWPSNVIWSKGGSPTMQVLATTGVDPSFLVTTGPNSPVLSIALQSDNKILIGGFFNSYNNTNSSAIARINTNGTIDNTFNVGSGFNGPVSNLAVQTDGKILVGGYFSSYNGNSVNRIVRLNSDGSIDNSFLIGTGFDSDVNTIKVQLDGKILVGGNFTDYNGTFVNRIVRLNSNGSIDLTFNIGTGFNGAVFDIKLLADNSVIVGGFFQVYNTNTVNGIAKLSTTGVFDVAFTQGTGFNGGVRSLCITSDNKILVAGDFNAYNGFSSPGVIKLNSNGTRDSSFNVGTGIGGTPVNTINVQSDGKVLVGGSFSSYNGTQTLCFVRLNADGTINTVFPMGTGPNSTVNSIVIQPDGKVLLGGQFFQFGPTVSPYITRIQEIVLNAYNAITFYYNGSNYIGSF